MSTDPILRILVPLPVAEGFDYLAPEGVPALGSLVEVPVGSKKMIGAVWGKGDGSIPHSKLKSIGHALDLPPLPDVTRRFVDWVAHYTVTPPGAILKMVFGGRLRPAKDKDRLDFPQPDPDHQSPDLTSEQRKAAEHLKACVKDGVFSVTLLDGVTGSGKTEVYCEALATALRQGRQALVLLPEIAMTAALIDRLAARFGVRPVEWHSELTEKQRRLNWNAIARGEARFVLGARSALFLPYPDLGLIVVDEEHEAAYKQEDGVIYHGRDMAVVRAQLGGIPVILASATPSLETMHNVQKKKYHHAVLRERFGNATMPDIKLVDLRQEKMPAQNFISAPLLEALQQTFAQGQQAMLFLNRRGYAPLTLCRACGHRLKCPHCTSWLIEHKHSKRLHCHHCDYSVYLPKACPHCHVEGRLAACGPGVERIAEEVKLRLPDARFAIMASDTLSGPKQAQELIKQMEDRSLDLLIGTQIMAKGYHFPRLTLVGVIDADLGLSGGDPRTTERTFQLLQQVAGRSGRAGDEGRVLLQTTSPEHPVMKALVKGDRDAFMAAEMKERSAYHLPPFSRLACITLSGKNTRQVIEAANAVAAAAPRLDGLRVLGPAPAPFAVLRGRHRHRLLVQARRTANVSAILRAWLTPFKLPRAIRVQVDVDPYSFL
ncbi:MAG: primosomal protein N' [Alphaproteobacteria bacterium]|nr:primosomal protein N' [Alphaproteobacteria bacterium]